MTFYNEFKGLKADKKYNKENALSLALACELAYKSESTIRKHVKEWDYKLEDFVSITKKPDIDTQCYIMSDDNNVVIVFRGSDSKSDWIGNFQSSYDPGPFKNTKAHEGFQDALFPSVIKITETMESACCKDKKLWVTGHSLGGALSSLFAGMLLENDRDVYGIYTFASPRPGNKSFSENLEGNIKGPHFRVVNEGDLVPHVPPEPFFSHSGERVILFDDNTTMSHDVWNSQRVQALGEFVDKAIENIDFFKKHSLTTKDIGYIPRLLKSITNGTEVIVNDVTKMNQLSTNDFKSLLDDYFAPPAKRTRLTESEVKALAKLLNEKVNIPVVSETGEEKILFKIILHVDELLYDNLPNEIYDLVRSFDNGLGNEEVKRLIKTLSKKANDVVDIPYIPEGIEQKTLEFLIGIILNALQRNFDIMKSIERGKTLPDITNMKTQEIWFNPA